VIPPPPTPVPIPEPARDVASAFAALPGVTAVAMAGSRATGRADADSDIDLYVYAAGEVPLAAREAIAAGTMSPEIDQSPWEPGDSWLDPGSGRTIDVMYRTPRWIEEALDRVLVRHEASVGYSTCFWQNVLVSVPIYDRDGWFRRLQGVARQPYPEPLRQAVIDKNYPVLRESRFSFLHQVEAAMAHGDVVAVQHRIAALLASFFDVLFALNRLPHPGEKRLAATATALPLAPAELAAQIDALMRRTAPPWSDGGPVPVAGAMIDGLNRLLIAERSAMGSATGPDAAPAAFGQPGGLAPSGEEAETAATTEAAGAADQPASHARPRGRRSEPQRARQRKDTPR